LGGGRKKPRKKHPANEHQGLRGVGVQARRAAETDASTGRQKFSGDGGQKIAWADTGGDLKTPGTIPTRRCVNKNRKL